MNSHDRDPLLDHRSRLEHDRLQAEVRRQEELAEQTSPMHSAEARIRTWERRHQLTLPLRADHRLIDVIAKATALTRAEVCEEQRQRAESAKPAVASGNSIAS